MGFGGDCGAFVPAGIQKVYYVKPERCSRVSEQYIYLFPLSLNSCANQFHDGTPLGYIGFRRGDEVTKDIGQGPEQLDIPVVLDSLCSQEMRSQAIREPSAAFLDLPNGASGPMFPYEGQAEIGNAC